MIGDVQVNDLKGTMNVRYEITSIERLCMQLFPSAVARQSGGNGRPVDAQPSLSSHFRCLKRPLRADTFPSTSQRDCELRPIQRVIQSLLKQGDDVFLRTVGSC